MTIQLTVGTRIYRPARLVAAGNGDQVELGTVTMKDFGDGTVMLRAAPWEAYLPDWLAVPWETSGGPGLRLRRAHPGRLDLFRGLVLGRQFCGGLARGRRSGRTEAQTPGGAPTISRAGANPIGRSVVSRPLIPIRNQTTIFWKGRTHVSALN